MGYRMLARGAIRIHSLFMRMLTVIRVGMSVAILAKAFRSMAVISLAVGHTKVLAGIISIPTVTNTASAARTQQVQPIADVAGSCLRREMTCTSAARKLFSKLTNLVLQLPNTAHSL